MAKKGDGPRMHVKIWLEEGGEIIFGQGMAMLLAEVERTGSLSSAAKELGMSYRAAWGKLKDCEARLGEALVEKRGRSNKSGYQLSDQGRSLLASYEAWNASVQELALREAEKHFPWPVSR